VWKAWYVCKILTNLDFGFVWKAWYVCKILTNLDFLGRFWNKFPLPNFRKSVQTEPIWYMRKYGRTHDEAEKLFCWLCECTYKTTVKLWRLLCMLHILEVPCSNRGSSVGFRDITWQSVLQFRVKKWVNIWSETARTKDILKYVRRVSRKKK